MNLIVGYTPQIGHPHFFGMYQIRYVSSEYAITLSLSLHYLLRTYMFIWRALLRFFLTVTQYMEMNSKIRYKCLCHQYVT